MSEKRFVIGDDNIAMFEVIDMEKEELVCECRAIDVETLVNLLNSLAEENEQLRQMIKENVFGRYEEGSLVDLEFKAIAYDDIIKLEIPNESEPKLIVTCKPGKVENVKSFCQMFIPFAMDYEIKEIIE